MPGGCPLREWSVLRIGGADAKRIVPRLHLPLTAAHTVLLERIGRKPPVIFDNPSDRKPHTRKYSHYK